MKNLVCILVSMVFIFMSCSDNSDDYVKNPQGSIVEKWDLLQLQYLSHEVNAVPSIEDASDWGSIIEFNSDGTGVFSFTYVVTVPGGEFNHGRFFEEDTFLECGFKYTIFENTISFTPTDENHKHTSFPLQSTLIISELSSNKLSLTRSGYEYDTTRIFVK